MKVKCEYCHSFIDESVEKCPNCGGINGAMRREDETSPKTIMELQNWYKAHNLPPYETTRFFIGIDYQEPKAYGIFEESGTFVVYKNKADGTRAIRYEGSDEAYAVNEIYEKLKTEIAYQKGLNQKKFSFSDDKKEKLPLGKKIKYDLKHLFRKRTPKEMEELWYVLENVSDIAVPVLFLLCMRLFFGLFKGHCAFYMFIAIVPLICITVTINIAIKKLLKKDNTDDFFSKNPLVWLVLLTALAASLVLGGLNRYDGYYKINDRHYYCIQRDWYENTNNYWVKVDQPVEYEDSSDYYEGYYHFLSGTDAANFADSIYYDNYSWSDSWDDNDSNWSSSDSWDSDSTSSGWDSDW